MFSLIIFGFSKKKSLIIFGPYLTKVYLRIKLIGNLKTHTTYLILIKHVFNSDIASNNC